MRANGSIDPTGPLVGLACRGCPLVSLRLPVPACCLGIAHGLYLAAVGRPKARGWRCARRRVRGDAWREVPHGGGVCVGARSLSCGGSHVPGAQGGAQGEQTAIQEGAGAPCKDSQVRLAAAVGAQLRDGAVREWRMGLLPCVQCIPPPPPPCATQDSVGFFTAQWPPSARSLCALFSVCLGVSLRVVALCSGATPAPVRNSRRACSLPPPPRRRLLRPSARALCSPPSPERR
jgi:hypothetical protein